MHLQNALCFAAHPTFMASAAANRSTMTDEILSIRFTGPALETRSLPIYELGMALIAIQRIVNKASLYSDDRLERGAHLVTKEREEVALQVVSHRKGSDLWGLSSYLTNPAVGPIVQGLVVAGLSAIAAYVWKKVIPDKKAPRNQVLIVNIYPEIKALTDRIRNIGGVDSIEIIGPNKKEDPLLLNEEVQEYVREIENRHVPGKKRKITGCVTRMHPQSFRLDIEDAPNHYIRVTMDPELFERVRRLPTLIERIISFEGIPLYKLGDIGGKVDAFHADRLIIPRKKRA